MAISASLVVPRVNASATITPSSGEAMMNLPQSFTVTGLNASEEYRIQVDESTEISSIIASSGGEITFSITFSTAGAHTVSVQHYFNESSYTTVATAQMNVTDLVALVVPIIMLFITFGILFAIKDELTDIV
jgi:hypothetical protein